MTHDVPDRPNRDLPGRGSPEGNPSQGQTDPDSSGRGQMSAPSPASDSAR
jgi:hypothetical protein